MPRRVTYRRESALERRLVAGLTRLDGRARVLKLTPQSQAGYPDRLVLLPGKQVLFVELKDDGEEPSALQAERHSELAELGLPVFVVAGRAQLDLFLSLVDQLLRSQ